MGKKNVIITFKTNAFQIAIFSGDPCVSKSEAIAKVNGFPDVD